MDIFLLQGKTQKKKKGEQVEPPATPQSMQDDDDETQLTPKQLNPKHKNQKKITTMMTKMKSHLALKQTLNKTKNRKTTDHCQ